MAQPARATLINDHRPYSPNERALAGLAPSRGGAGREVLERGVGGTEVPAIAVAAIGRQVSRCPLPRRSPRPSCRIAEGRRPFGSLVRRAELSKTQWLRTSPPARPHTTAPLQLSTPTRTPSH